jgi:hypothetical protein
MPRWVHAHAGMNNNDPRNEKAELKSARDYDHLLTTEEAADLLRLSTSWLAKARMRGDGPLS